MDPVTMAILAAWASGISMGSAKVGEELILDAYKGLKSLLRQKFGEESKVVVALEDLEENPKSEGRKVTLAEEIVAVKADHDIEILDAASNLIHQIEALPNGRQILFNVHGNRTVSIGGNVSNSTLITGDQNKLSHK